jgi:hypothetical protein
MKAVVDTGTSLSFVPKAHSTEFFSQLLKDVDYST